MPPATYACGTRRAGIRLYTIVIAVFFSVAWVLVDDGARAEPVGALVHQPSPQLEQLGGRARYVDDFGAVGNGSTDDSRAWIAAFRECVSAGGGVIHLGPKRYRIASNVTIPSGCKLACDTVPLGNANTPDYQHTRFIILLEPPATITMMAQSGWSGCSVMNSNLRATPVSTRDELDLVKSFSGTGIVLNGADIEVEKAAILGFAVAVSSGEHNHTARLHMSDVNMDATSCLQHYRSYDVSHLRSLHCFPFLTAANGAARVPFRVLDMRADAKGRYEVTLADPAPLVTGDTVWLSNCGLNGCKAGIGAQSSRNRWTVDVVDARHIQLIGSSAVGAVVTASARDGEYALAGILLSDFKKIGIGDRVEGPNIAAGTRIAYKWPRQQIVGLTAPIKGNGVASYKISDDAYRSGGTLWIDAEQRTGIAFDFLDSATTACMDCFELGHDVGFHLGAGNEGQSVDWFSAIGPQCDQINSLEDPTTTCIVIDGNSTGSSWLGGSSQSIGTSIVVNTTAAGPHTFTGMQLNINPGGEGAILELDRGPVTMIGNASPPARFPIFVADAASQLVSIGNNLTNRYFFQSRQSAAKLVAAANVLATPVPDQTGGRSVAALKVTDGGTYELAAERQSYIIKSESDLAALTLTLPALPTTGQELNLFFNHAIGRLLPRADATVFGWPSSVKADTWHRCQVEMQGGPWYCD